MKCFRCRAVVSDELANSRYCVSCGFPVTQLCPYRPEQCEWIPRYSNDELPMHMCPTCRSPFKHCPVCGLLHRLNDRECSLCADHVALAEIGEAWPAASTALSGPLSGVRHGALPAMGIPAAAISSGLATNQEPLAAQPHQLMVYRYGILMLISGQRVTFHTWQGSAWAPSGHVLFDDPGAAPFTSAVADHGMLYLGAIDRTVVVDIAGKAVTSRIWEGVVHQVTGSDRWLRLVGNGDRLDAVITCAGADAGTPDRFPLQCRADQVNGLACDGDTAYLATSAGLFSIALKTGAVNLLMPAEPEWRRVALQDGRLFALGLSPGTGEVRLIWRDVNTEAGERVRINEAILLDLALSPDTVVLPGTQGTLKVLQLEALAHVPATVNLAGGALNADGLIAITRGSRSGVIISQVEPVGANGQGQAAPGNGAARGNWRVFMVDLATGHSSQVGPMLAEQPLVCLADGKVIVSSPTRGQVRTYPFRP